MVLSTMRMNVRLTWKGEPKVAEVLTSAVAKVGPRHSTSARAAFLGRGTQRAAPGCLKLHLM